METILVALAAGLGGGFLAPVITRWVRARRMGVPAVAGDEEVFFWVRALEGDGRASEYPFNARQGARARDAYFDAMKRPKVHKVELWARTGEEWSLRSDWERD